MGKFIYVFSSRDKSDLLSKNYNLLKSDDTNEIYVFEAKEQMQFELKGIDFVQSDVLTFT